MKPNKDIKEELKECIQNEDDFARETNVGPEIGLD